MSAPGECLAAQKKFQDAETLTVGSYEELKASQGEKSLNTIDALNRVIKLYEMWNKPEDAERFRAKLIKQSSEQTRRTYRIENSKPPGFPN